MSNDHPIIIEDIPCDSAMMEYIRRRIEERERDFPMIIIDQPVLELPVPPISIPLFPPKSEDKQDSEESGRGVAVIQIL